LQYLRKKNSIVKILGLSFNYRASAAASLYKSQLVAAAEEERFTRKKHDAAFTQMVSEWCPHFAHIPI